jgi:hypothetical protein
VAVECDVVDSDPLWVSHRHVRCKAVLALVPAVLITLAPSAEARDPAGNARAVTKKLAPKLNKKRRKRKR